MDNENEKVSNIEIAMDTINGTVKCKDCKYGKKATNEIWIAEMINCCRKEDNESFLSNVHTPDWSCVDGERK